MNGISSLALDGPAAAEAAQLLKQSWAVMYDDVDRCAALAQAAAQAARASGDLALAGVAQALTLTALVQYGPVDEATRQLEQLRAKLVVESQQRGLWVCDDLLSLLELRLGQVQAARQRLQQIDAIATTERSLMERRHTLGLLTILEFHDGAYDLALPLAHRLLALARATNVATLEGVALHALATIHIAVMDHETGLPMLAQACALMAISGSRPARLQGYANTICAQYAAGRAADAAQTLHAWMADCGPPDPTANGIGRYHVAFALGHLAGGAVAAAKDILGEAPPAEWIERTSVASWHWARGWLLLAMDRPDEAQALCLGFLASLDPAAKALMPMDAVQLQQVLRRAAETLGDWQGTLRAAKALRDAELPLLRVHARVRFLTVQWQLQAQGHTSDQRLVQQRLAALERSIARHASAWTLDIEPLGVPAPAHTTTHHRQMAYIGHEIRTPLSGLLGLTDLLQRTPLNEQQQQLVSLARTTADSLMHLLNDMIDLAKIEAGHFKLQNQPFSVHQLVQESAAFAQPLAMLRKLDFQVWTDPQLPSLLMGDGPRLRQVLGNLLNNALKFTPSGHIGLQVQCTDRGDPVGLRLEVSDSGRGVPPALKPQLFAEFVQEDQTALNGSGLGLAICRQIVEAMGGRIGMKDRVGGGSVFWVELSLAHCPSLSFGSASA
jgi:signal transduction histidine kinase